MATLDIFKESTQQRIEQEMRLANAQLAIIAKGYEIDSWAALQELADTGLASRYLNIGDQVPGTWKDMATGTEYDAPWDIVHFGTIETPQGATKNAIFVQSHWCTPFTCEFDQNETGEEATEETAQEGVYYIATDGTNWSKLDLATGDTIPYGDYTHIYRNSINDINIVRYGYNRWRDSGYRQWLNSAAEPNAWWSSTHVGDKAPAIASTKHGFMSGLPADMLAVVNPIKVKTALNTVTDGGTSTAGFDVTEDKFFLPCLEEMYGSPQLAGEGMAWDYWKAATGLTSPSNNANDGRKIYGMENHSSARYCRLRSCGRSASNIVWTCFTSGQLNSNSAHAACRAAPACAIYKP